MRNQLNVTLTKQFSEFIHNLKDPLGKARILSRLARLENGNWGDAAPIGDGLTELRINVGPGYRVYCMQDGLEVVVVLGGGTKNRQQADIDAAKAYAKELK